jgi:hypothetical protein
MVYKIGGGSADCQFFNEPSKEIPYGYACTYIPDSSNVGHANQTATGGVTTQTGPQGWTTKCTGNSSSAEADKQAWIAKYATQGPSTTLSAQGGVTNDQIAEILKDQFGLIPRRKITGYNKPYPSSFDLIPLPPKCKIPDFTKFNGSDGSNSIEHISRYLSQLGVMAQSDPLKVRLFALSLTGPAFVGPRVNHHVEAA